MFGRHGDDNMFPSQGFHFLSHRLARLTRMTIQAPPRHTWKRGLRAKLRAAAGEGSRADPRELARRLGQQVASNLDAYWEASKDAQAGPIDVIDMFCGCGGASVGFHAVNGLIPAYRLALGIDLDKKAILSYEENLGVLPKAKDIGDLARDPGALKDLCSLAGVDGSRPLVLIGCAPCQGFSSHRNGKIDTRNTLFSDFIEIATILRPDVLVIENVPELLTNRYWPFVADAKEALGEAGYSVHVDFHNTAEFGVPQERFRTLLLAFRDQKFRPPEGFLSRGEFRTVRDAIARLPAIPAGRARTPDPMHYTAGHRDSTLDVIRAVPKDGGNRPPGVGPACLQRAEKRQGKPIYEDVYGRLYWDRPAITITAYARNPASGRFIHPEQDRGLSVREAALLQSFPQDFNLVGSMDERFRQVGNAVPPAFSAYLAVHILGELLAKPLRGESQSSGLEGPIGPSFSRVIPAIKAGTYRHSYKQKRPLGAPKV